MTELIKIQPTTRPRYMSLYKGSWGHELLGALRVSFKREGPKTCLWGLSTPFCNHVNLHHTIYIRGRIIPERTLRQRDERLVSCFAFFHTRKYCIYTFKWSWADITSSIRISFCTIWVVRGIIPALPILGISHFPQAKKVRLLNVCTLERLVALTCPLFHVFTRIVMVQLFYLGIVVADPFNNC